MWRQVYNLSDSSTSPRGSRSAVGHLLFGEQSATIDAKCAVYAHYSPKHVGIKPPYFENNRIPPTQLSHLRVVRGTHAWPVGRHMQ